MRLLVTSANGTQSGGPTDYVSAATDPARSLALAFVPNTGTSAQSLTIDLRQMAGTTQARWWDPTTGGYTTIGTFANTAWSRIRRSLPSCRQRVDVAARRVSRM